jgi:hypothetical protein
MKCPDAAELAACLMIAARHLARPGWPRVSDADSQRIAEALVGWNEAHGYEPPTLTPLGNVRDALHNEETAEGGRPPPESPPPKIPKPGDAEQF